MKWNELSENYCPLARTMSVIGDRWTVLILRECFFGTEKYEDFQINLGVARHILSDRLNRLVEHGILDKVRYSNHKKRFDYRLTEKGKALSPALTELAQWGKTHIPVRRPAEQSAPYADRGVKE